MSQQYRFASLKGQSRKWVEEFEEELETEVLINEEPEHDGWWPIAKRSRPLCTLGDLMQIGSR